MAHRSYKGLTAPPTPRVAPPGTIAAAYNQALLLYPHLLKAAFGNQTALQALITSTGYKADYEIHALNETVLMLVVLALIDVVMISNLLIMVIVGGYETFVSRMNLQTHPDQPEWLSHVNASVLKVKLATAIIGISSIHLLKTFINAANYDVKVLMWQTIIHVVFLLSALAIAYTDTLMVQSKPASPRSGHLQAGSILRIGLPCRRSTRG